MKRLNEEEIDEDVEESEESKVTFKVTKSTGEIAANFEELKKAVKSQVAKYKGLVYIDDQIKEAKSDLAWLRLNRKKIDDARKSVKKEFMKPFDDFEARVKETLEIYDTAINEIDLQVKSAESAAKEKKHAEIEAWWKENGVKSVEGIELSAVWDDKYLNKTFTEKKWQEDLKGKAEAIEADLKTISFLEAEMCNFVLPKYLESLNLTMAINDWKMFDENRRRTEEIRRQAEEARKAREAKTQAQAPIQAIPEVKPQDTIISSQKNTEVVKGKKRYAMTFSIEGNASATKELCDLLRKLKSEGSLTFTVIEKRDWEE